MNAFAAVTTSSPTSPFTAFPAASKPPTWAPRNRPEPLAVRVVPEPDWHGRHRRGHDQLADLPGHRLAGRVEGLHLGAEEPPGDDPGPYRQQRARPDEPRADVRSPGHRAEYQVRMN